MGLAQQLRELDDDALADLLVARPDLLERPVPGFEQLAARAATWRSQARCLAGLDLFSHQIIELVALTHEPATIDGVAELAGPTVSSDELAGGCQRLHRLGLLEYRPPRVRLVGELSARAGNASGLGRPARRLLADRPLEELRGLARRLGVGASGSDGRTARKPELVAALAARIEDRSWLAEQLDAAPAAVRELLDRLDASGRHLLATYRPGAYRRPGSSDPGDAVGWLLDRGLLVETAWGAAELVAELGLFRRGGVLFPGMQADPPALLAVPLGPGLDVPAEAGLAAARVLDLLTRLVHDLAGEPAPLLKAGGVGVRVVRRVATLTDLPERDAAMLVELASAVGLVDQAGDTLRPSALFDDWLALPSADRWLHVHRSWLAARAYLRAAGARDEADRPVAPLGPLTSGFDAPEQRRAVLDALAEAPPGHAVDLESLVARLVWVLPHRWLTVPAEPDVAVRWFLEEAALVGAVVTGGLSPATRLELLGDADAARAAAELGLPAPESHVILQADLTALAMGQLDPRVAGDLARLADVESRGSATVYRFSPASLGRAVAAGSTAGEIVEVLERCSRNGVPNPLRVLVDDVARRYGRARVGTATSYLRCDDAALLAELVRHRRLAKLGLRTLAPTVAVSASPAGAVLDAIATAGYLPAEEGDDGQLVVRRPPRPSRAKRGRLLAGPASGPPGGAGAGAANRDRAASHDHGAGVDHPASSEHPTSGGPVDRAREAVAALRSGSAAGPPSAGTSTRGGSPPSLFDAEALAAGDPDAFRAVLSTARREVRAVDLAVYDDDGTVVDLLVTPVSVAADHVVLLCSDCDELHHVGFDEIEWLELLGPWADESRRRR